MKKITRKTPQSVKTQRKIDAALAEQHAVHIQQIEALQQKNGEVVGLLQNELDVSQQPVIVKNSGQHVPQVLLRAIQKNRNSILPIQDRNKGMIVSNWQNSWKWFSNIAFALIVAVQAFYDALPPEVLTALPADTQQTITAVLAILGILGRFINQSRNKDAGHV